MARSYRTVIKVFPAETRYEYYGLSTEEKPIPDDIISGSTFIEEDTGDTYFFDEDNGEWLKVGG